MKISRMNITTKICPKCDAEHIKPGKFCSRACANSRQWNDEHKKVFSLRQKEYMSRDESEEHREKRRLQVQILLAQGVMGKGYKGEEEEEENIMRNPDDYFLLPVQYIDLDVEDGTVWEDI